MDTERAKTYQGVRIMRIVVDPKGKHAKQHVFASGWLDGKQSFHGRPDA